MSELSHFEELSTQTPKKQPYAILIGTVMFTFLLWLLNFISPSEGVADLKKAEEEGKRATVQSADDGEEI
ncbi:MAG: hypothetical protein GY854_23275 [Deltaproteobacteria bacterium]|nr:hypothetical protein [Deltaproteobacteria bacterium]